MPEDAMLDALILAAIERAERHMVRKEPGVVYGNVVDHLARPRHAGTGRRLRPRFRELEATGLVESFKKYGCIVYTLTPEGRTRLKAVGPVSLPESPQHRVWRTSRATAGKRMSEFRNELRFALREGRALLMDHGASSEAWFELGEGLQHACSRLGSATHCLREWAEPSDEKPDVDRGPWLGRRTTWLWD